MTEIILLIRLFFGVNSGEFLRGGDFMKNIVFILLSFCLAGEMEIDGDLTVLGSVNAPGLGGMQPERIYSKITAGGESFTVPNDTYWRVLLNTSTGNTTYQFYHSVTITGISGENAYFVISGHKGGPTNTTREYWLYPGYTITPNYGASSQQSTIYYMTIFEYPISGSGTDQGMDYIEP